MSHSEDEDAYLYGSDNEEEQSSKKQKTEATPEESPEASGDESADSDDDIDIIIGDIAAPAVTAPATETTESSGTTVTTEESKEPITTIISKGQDESSIDINAIAEYEGKPITQHDPETFKTKPWRAPGADISDYFNYGFNEITWMAYCHKQDNLRGEFDPQKIMEKIMKGSGGSAPPIPPMGMMPPPMMPGMPPFPMPPNMNMKNMPNFPNMNFKKK